MIISLLFSLVNAQETCETNVDLCNNVDYTASICKVYKTKVPQDGTHETQLKNEEQSLLTTELNTIFEQTKYFDEAIFTLTSFHPVNPEDIQSEDITKTSESNGFLFAYKMITTHAVMNVCGKMKLKFFEHFREEIKTEEEWNLLVENQLQSLEQVSLVSDPTLEMYDPDAGRVSSSRFMV